MYNAFDSIATTFDTTFDTTFLIQLLIPLPMKLWKYFGGVEMVREVSSKLPARMRSVDASVTSHRRIRRRHKVLMTVSDTSARFGISSMPAVERHRRCHLIVKWPYEEPCSLTSSRQIGEWDDVSTALLVTSLRFWNQLNVSHRTAHVMSFEDEVTFWRTVFCDLKQNRSGSEIIRGAPDRLSGWIIHRIVDFRAIRYPAGHFSLSGRIAGH